jgi:hypothetical protein
MGATGRNQTNHHLKEGKRNKLQMESRGKNRGGVRDSASSNSPTSQINLSKVNLLFVLYVLDMNLE